MLRKTILAILVVFSASSQVLTAMLLQDRLWGWALVPVAIPLIISAVLYSTVPTSKKLVHGLLELIHKRIGLTGKCIVDKKSISYSIRCSLMVSTGLKRNGKLRVQYRYPIEKTSTTFDVRAGGLGEGIAGVAFRSGEFQEDTDIPLGDSDHWRKWHIPAEKAAKWHSSKMRSIYCWPVRNLSDHKDVVAILAIDSKCPEVLTRKHKKDIEDIFIPLIEHALHTNTQAGLRTTVIDALRFLTKSGG